MNKDFQRLYKQFLDKQITLTQLRDALKLVGDFSDDLLEVIQEAVATQNWPRLNAMLHVAFLVPDRKFTPLLCDLLDNHRNESDMEALADLLGDIADERSLPSIIQALNLYLWWDDDSHFNRKLIVALHNIGTKEALEGIKLALQSPKELIREDAQFFLDKYKEESA